MSTFVRMSTHVLSLSYVETEVFLDVVCMARKE